VISRTCLKSEIEVFKKGSNEVIDLVDDDDDDDDNNDVDNDVDNEIGTENNNE
jgi:hypothetical protein